MFMACLEGDAGPDCQRLRDQNRARVLTILGFLQIPATELQDLFTLPAVFPYIGACTNLA